MRFKLTVLGSSSALPTISKYPTAHVLNIREQFYLIDAGEGVQKQLKKADVSVLKINHIFVSHLHGDHIYGIFGLISSMGLLGRERVLNIFAPAPISDIIANHIKFFDNWLPFKIICNEIDTKVAKVIYETDSIQVESIPLKHSVPCCGFLFREKPAKLNVDKSKIQKYNIGLAQIVRIKNGEDLELSSGEIIPNSQLTYLPYEPRSFAYCCDTAYTERFLEQIKGVDMLMHEATYLKEDSKTARKRFHSTTHDAANIAIKAEAKKLIITHFSTRYNTPTSKFLEETKEVFESSYLARELESFEIDFKKNK